MNKKIDFSDMLFIILLIYIQINILVINNSINTLYKDNIESININNKNNISTIKIKNNLDLINKLTDSTTNGNIKRNILRRE